MSTILLTSAGTGVLGEIEQLFDKPAAEVRMAHIITAANKKTDQRYLEKERRGLELAGFNAEEVDLEGKSAEGLRLELSGKDAIYVQGGDVFWLLKHVQLSGFSEVVKELLKKGVYYIGVSAGSYICCPTIEMAFFKRQQPDLSGLTDLRGMDLVPFLLSVHYKPEYHELLRDAASKNSRPVRVLTDQQAFLVKDGTISLRGEGPEIVLI